MYRAAIERVGGNDTISAAETIIRVLDPHSSVIRVQGSDTPVKTTSRHEYLSLQLCIVQGYIYLNLETGSPYGSSSITQRGYIARYNKCVRIRYIIERAHAFLT